ncbi:alkylhydroperoxidase AhpD family core domain-containing protein [Zhouia amylolytica]|uniref:Alkylhydroperoxidase AhpD family core domain-containing protein n=1 Tax=Zhouia amylolytica TaxID=376730 RepID=A0A1I6UIL3_9FLAO|nr:carboxymuconolactone decarboxylase family protein [Zhouia amylolytica]SFT01258.1 alkylhydroperoxidase AhpD family core domain-containing protein [Zhouia amylolytica]
MIQIKEQDIPPGYYEKLMVVENYLKEIPIEIGLLELIRLRVSQLNKCAYCVDMHHKELRNTGDTELRLASLCVWQETPYFTEKERLILQFTEELTILKDHSIGQSLLDNLGRFFTKNEICQLTLAIAQINTWTRLMRAFSFTPGNYQVKNHHQ